jgi:hypothetical protein
MPKGFYFDSLKGKDVWKYLQGNNGMGDIIKMDL